MLCLISGGGSALLALPAAGLTLADKQAVNRALLASGADIGQMNCVRKHLSAIKGGRLAAAAHPARVVSLLISDIPGDDPAAIASGPTVADPSTFAEARAVLARYRIEPPAAVRRTSKPARRRHPSPAIRAWPAIDNMMIATPQRSLEAAAEVARQAGVTPLLLGDALEGEAPEAGRLMAGIARSVARARAATAAALRAALRRRDHRDRPRAGAAAAATSSSCWRSAVALNGISGVWAIAGDTDGIDGAEEVAGARRDPDTLARAAPGDRARRGSPTMTATASSRRWVTR